MSPNKTKTKKTGLEKAIDSVLAEMQGITADQDRFSKMVDQLDKLYKMKSYEKDNRVSLDALVAVAGNFVGIVLILGFERVHVVTSKALGFVLKSRV